MVLKLVTRDVVVITLILHEEWGIPSGTRKTSSYFGCEIRIQDVRVLRPSINIAYHCIRLNSNGYNLFYIVCLIRIHYLSLLVVYNWIMQ